MSETKLLHTQSHQRYIFCGRNCGRKLPGSDPGHCMSIGGKWGRIFKTCFCVQNKNYCWLKGPNETTEKKISISYQTNKPSNKQGSERAYNSTLQYPNFHHLLWLIFFFYFCSI